MSGFLTKSNLILDVQTELGLVAGTGVQIYTEPQIEAKILKSFNTLADMIFWPHLTKNTYHSLDGVNGLVTDDEISGVQDVTDIEWIKVSPYEECNKLIYLNGDPYETVEPQIAYETLHWEDEFFNTKHIKIYPLDTSETIMIRARRKPASFPTNTSVVPLDGTMLTHYIAWQMLSIDGINPDAANVQYGLFTDRYSVLMENQSAVVKRYNRTKQYSDTFTVAE